MPVGLPSIWEKMHEMISRVLIALAIPALAGLYEILPVSAVQDDDLVAVLERQAAERGLRPPQHDQVKYMDLPSRVVPGLNYRWASYEVTEVQPSYRLFAVAVVSKGQTRILRTGSDWGAAAAPWEPRTAAVAKQACVEMFQVLHARLGPDPHSYVEYDPGRTRLPRMSSENRDLLLQKVRSRSQVRRDRTAGQLEQRIWILGIGHSVSAYRVRCRYPFHFPVTPPSYSLTVTDSVIGPRNRLVI